MSQTLKLRRTYLISYMTLSAALQYMHTPQQQMNKIVSHQGVVIEDGRVPWDVFIGIIKRSLRKIIEKLSLTSSQLPTVLSEVKPIVNTRPLVYVDNSLKPRIIIPPMHLLSMNPKVGSASTVNDHQDDPNYNINNLSSLEELIKICKKAQRHLE